MRTITIPAAIALNATTYVLIDSSGVPATSFMIQCRTAVDVLLASSSSPAAEAYFTLKAGTAIPIDTEGSPLGKKLNMYAKASVGTPLLEIIILKS